MTEMDSLPNTTSDTYRNRIFAEHHPDAGNIELRRHGYSAVIGCADSCIKQWKFGDVDRDCDCGERAICGV